MKKQYFQPVSKVSATITLAEGKIDQQKLESFVQMSNWMTPEKIGICFTIEKKAKRIEWYYFPRFFCNIALHIQFEASCSQELSNNVHVKYQIGMNSCVPLPPLKASRVSEEK